MSSPALYMPVLRSRVLLAHAVVWSNSARAAEPQVRHHEEHQGHEERLQDKALEAILQYCDGEVDQQTGPDARQPHVCKKVRLMDAEEILHRLQLENQAVLDQYVDPYPQSRRTDRACVFSPCCGSGMVGADGEN